MSPSKQRGIISKTKILPSHSLALFVDSGNKLWQRWTEERREQTGLTDKKFAPTQIDETSWNTQKAHPIFELNGYHKYELTGSLRKNGR